MPADLATLSALKARVEAATGSDQELDAEILCALIAPSGSKVEQSPINGNWCIWEPRTYGQKPFGLWNVPSPWRHDHASVTGSVDAALALAKVALPEWSLNLMLGEGYRHPCAIMGRSHPTNARVAVEHHTAPLAILAAIIAALAETSHAR